MNSATEDMAYAAGMLDGEGSILLDKNGKHKRGYHLVVTINNTNIDVLLWLKSRFMDFVTQNYEARGNRRACFRWTIKNQEAAEFLHQVYKFLIIKAAQARVALFVQAGKHSGGNFGLTPNQIAVEEFLVEQMKVLRGVKKEVIEDAKLSPD